jgi:hypothetical protein
MKKAKLNAIQTMEKCLKALDDRNDMRPEIRRYLAEGIAAQEKHNQKINLELIEAHGKISKAHAVIRTLHETLKTGQPVQWHHRETLELIDDMTFEALLCIGTAGEMTE